MIGRLLCALGLHRFGKTGMYLGADECYWRLRFCRRRRCPAAVHG